MAVYRAQVNLQAQDGLPRDVFENVLYFNSGGGEASSGDIASISSGIAAAYSSIQNWLSPILSPTVTVKFYDVSAAKGTPPFETSTFTIDPGGGFPAIPEEIAVCLSYFAGSNAKGSRGRIYTGPFSTNVLDESVTGDEGGNGVRPAAAYRTALKGFAGHLMGLTADVWCVRVSKPNVAFLPITGGWIDNEWDGQSRRRIAATTRTIFP